MKFVRSAIVGAAAAAVSAGAAVAAAPPSSVPGASVDNDHLFISGNVAVPLGEGAGALEVVLEGPTDGSSVPLIVRNNTDHPVYNVSVEGLARGADGSLVGSGSSLDLEPSTLQPGEWAIGSVYFDYDILDGTETFMFQTAYDTTPGFLNDVPLTVGEATLNESGFSPVIVGILLNEGDVAASLPRVMIGCFGDDGTLLGVESGYGEADEVAPGGFTSFSADLYDIDDCPNFAIAASGYD